MGRYIPGKDTYQLDAFALGVGPVELLRMLRALPCETSRAQVLETIPQTTQFWTMPPEEFLEQSLFSREFPPETWDPSQE